MNDSELYIHLGLIRKKYQETSPTSLDELCCNIEIGGHQYEQSVWLDFHGQSKLVIFQLKASSFLHSSHYCVGLIANKDGSYDALSNEQLWEMGLP